MTMPPSPALGQVRVVRNIGVIDYPFPLSDGSLFWFRIPSGTLSAVDAKRLCEYVRTLVAESEADE
jgi:hypothetical protein